MENYKKSGDCLYVTPQKDFAGRNCLLPIFKFKVMCGQYS